MVNQVHTVNSYTWDQQLSVPSEAQNLTLAQSGDLAADVLAKLRTTPSNPDIFFFIAEVSITFILLINKVPI